MYLKREIKELARKVSEGQKAVREAEAKLDQDFVRFLLFPQDGSGVLYDGVIFHFEEEIKSNELVREAYLGKEE